MFFCWVNISRFLFSRRSGDILSNALKIKGLVNSVNSQLLMGNPGGIAGAIKKRGGDMLIAECQQITLPLQITDVVVTDAHGLSDAGFSKIFHVRAPEYTGSSQNVQQMEASVFATLTKVGEEGLDSVVFPVLGAGIFAWQSDKPSLFSAVLNAVAAWGQQSGSSLKRIVVMDTNSELMKARVFLADFRGKPVNS